MESIQSEFLLIILCCVVVVSYLFSIGSRYIRVPSVLLLLLAGMGIRLIAEAYEYELNVPLLVVESLGVVGLIMIVLEAGLDLELKSSRIKLIRDSFLSALIILLLSTSLISYILYEYLQQPLLNCIVYAIPLSIISSSIVLPSLHALTEEKKDFLVYEASFSDILGIMLFNYFASPEIFSLKSIGVFSGNLLLSILLSGLVSILLLFIMTRTKLSIKFFLVFSLLVLIYAGGKMLHLPSLIIILAFGLMINNWHLFKSVPWIQQQFPQEQVNSLNQLLHSITAESSFLIRTFFFILFGFSIDFNMMLQNEVMQVGGVIVLSLFAVRFLYFRFFLKTNVFPEVFFIPRGLITIVLFYKIPQEMKLANFNEGILFFMILVTGAIMTLGMLFYKKKPSELVEEPAFSDRTDIF
jgi:Kef-type K+ transport system membrane component KefB